jgi:hypothetical protein
MTDKEREQDRLQMKSGANDPMTAPVPQEVRAHPTEGEKLQWGKAAAKTDLDKELAKTAQDTRPVAEN